MKKLLMSAFMVAILLGVNNVSADESASAVAETFSKISARGTALANGVMNLVPASSRAWATNNQKVVLGGSVLFAGVVLMYKTCPWFRKLFGTEDTATRKPRRLDTRVARPRRR